MTIRCPERFGFVLRKNERTARSIERMLRCPFPGPQLRLEDEHLIGFRVGDRDDLADQVLVLEREGCQRGIDFVCTFSLEGVLDNPVPAWLAVELAATGNPPELEAKMTPEVQAMWEAQRTWLFHLRYEGSDRPSSPSA